MKHTIAAVTIAFVASVALGTAQQKTYPYPTKRDLGPTIPRGPRLLPSPPLGDGPWNFHTTEADVRVSIVTRGISHPYAFAFLPDGVILVTERVGKLRVIRNGGLEPNPIEGLPPMIYRGTEAGLMDLALHPNSRRTTGSTSPITSRLATTWRAARSAAARGTERRSPT
jgi:glucose/arabinose dehydrogenase